MLLCRGQGENGERFLLGLFISRGIWLVHVPGRIKMMPRIYRRQYWRNADVCHQVMIIGFSMSITGCTTPLLQLPPFSAPTTTLHAVTFFQSLFRSGLNKSSFLPSLPFLQSNILDRSGSLPSIAWYFCAPK